MAKSTGNWYESIGTTHENSANREAPNRHLKGGKKYREKIHSDSKKSDFWKNLPFKFSKPPKGTKAREDIYHVCDFCHSISLVSKYRVGQTCRGCNRYTSVNSSNTFNDDDELELYLESLTPGEQ